MMIVFLVLLAITVLKTYSHLKNAQKEVIVLKDQLTMLNVQSIHSETVKEDKMKEHVNSVQQDISVTKWVLEI